jgi:hypothetical protein
MSTTEAAPVEAEQTADHGRGGKQRRRRLAVAAAVLVIIGAAGWWRLTTPQLQGGGTAGVSSEDHHVVTARGFRETVFVVPADSPGSSTIAFGVHNAGRLPVELLDVWPNTDDPMCFWQTSERWFQDDPSYIGILDDRARPAAGAVLPPGGYATIWVTGAHPDPDGCVHGAINTYDDVEVIVRVAGRTSTTRVPLGYTFGYTDEPEILRDFYDVEVVPPSTGQGGG